MSSKGKSKSNRSSPRTPGRTKGSEKQRKIVDQPPELGTSSKGIDLGIAMKSTIREEDVERIISIQHRGNFSKTNELLGQFNDFSSSKYDVLQHMFVQHTRLLVEMKNDLTNVFQRVRRLKVKLQKQYPGAFEATFNLRKALEDELEQEVPNEPTYNAKLNNDDIEHKRRPRRRDNVEGSSPSLLVQGNLHEEVATGRNQGNKVNSPKCDVMTGEESVAIETSSSGENECDEQDIANTLIIGNVKLDQTTPSERVGSVNLFENQRKSDNDIISAGTNLKVVETEVNETGGNMEVTNGDSTKAVANPEIAAGDSMDRAGDNQGMPGLLLDNRGQLREIECEVGETGDNLEKIDDILKETGDDVEGREGDLEGTIDNLEMDKEDSGNED